MKKRKAGSCCFTVTGEFVTRQARALFREGSFNRAMRFLLDSIIGFEDQHAVSILKGTHKLIGDSSLVIELVEDSDAEEYLAEIGQLYGGILKFKGLYYRPYAWINDFGSQDVALSSSRGYREFGQDAGYESFPTTGAMSAALHKARVRVYMERPFDDIHFKLLLPLGASHPDLNMREVLFKTVSMEVPYFIDIETDPQKVIEWSWKNVLLYKTGHSIRFPIQEPDTEQTIAARRARINAAYAGRNRKEAAEGVESVIAGTVTKLLASGMDPARVQELAGTMHKKYIKNEAPSKEFVPREQALPHDHGWLAPNGGFIPCLVMEHVELAVSLMGSEEKLENAGWRKLASGRWESPLFLPDGCRDKNQVTPEQHRFIRLWYEHRDRSDDFQSQELWVAGGG